MRTLKVARLISIVVALLLVTSLSTSASRADTGSPIDPALADALKSASPDQQISVIVILKDQADVRGLGGQNRAEKQRRVIEALQAKAHGTQNALIAILDARLKQGKVSSYTPLWVQNAIAVTADSDVIDELARFPAVDRIVPDITIQAPSPPAAAAATAGPAEPNISLINTLALWGLGFRGQNVVVANMDTGVDYTHPDLSAQWRGGSNSWYDPNGQHPSTPTDVSGHGTWTMSTMVGRDLGGTSIGIAPDAKWIAVKIFNDSGSAALSKIHLGYQWLLDPDGNPSTPDAPYVVNNSWAYNTSGCYLDFELDLQNLVAADITPVFSAGNYGPSGSTDRSPGNNPDAFAVGATDNGDVIASFSSRGPTSCGRSAPVTYPAVVAPGVSIRTADLFGLYTWVSGTSLSAPHVSGALALLLSAFPNLTVAQLETALTSRAADLGTAGPDNTFGAGRVDVLAAYNSISIASGNPPTATPTDTPAPAPTDTPTPTATSTPTPTDTPIPSTATFTPAPTDTPVPPTATPTATPLPPTATFTPTPTNTPTPSPTPTFTPIPPTATWTPTPTSTPAGGTNIALSGIAYRWRGNTSSSSNANQTAASILNDDSTASEVNLNGNGDDISNAWEAAGVIWASAQPLITRVEFVNGSTDGGTNSDGNFTANFKLQISADSTTWADATGWTLTPPYMYDQSVANQTYVLTGSASNVRGVRVTGQVHTSTIGSWYVRAREVRAFGTTSTPPDTPTPTPTSTPGGATPTSTATNTPTPTATPTSTPTTLPTATATPTAATNPIFLDGFESGNFSAWSATSGGTRISVTDAAAMQGALGMQATFNGNQASYAQDNTPANETSYHARFYFNPNGATTNGNQHDIFIGLNTANTVIFRVQYRRTFGSTYQIRAVVSRSGGTTATNWQTISNAAHPIEIAWQSSTSASYSLYIDGTLKQTLTGLNTNAYQLDTIRLGPSGGLATGMSGTEYYDAFVSTRNTLIGP